MDDREALDYARGFYSRIVKPFERLPEVLEKVASAEERVRVAEAALGPLVARQEALTVEIATLQGQQGQAQAALDAERASVTAEHARLVADVQAARDQARTQIEDAQDIAASAIAVAQAEADARTVSLHAEIAALEARVEQLERKRQEFAALLG